MDAQDLAQYTDLAVTYGLKAVFALAILILGWMVAKLLRRFARKAMARGKLDATLSNFLSNILYALIMAFVFIATLNKVGVQTASLIAVVGAAGLAIGLALQGSLSNFAAGVMIILFKHFKVGDFVDAAGQSGTVSNLDIFNTTLLTGNNQTVIIPNSSVTSGAVVNYSTKDTRRIDLTIGIGYSDNIKHAKKVVLELIEHQPKLMDLPEPSVFVKNLGDSSVDLGIRCWVKNGDYWGAYAELLESIKIAFDDNGISIPYPQRDLHMVSASVAQQAA